jgi:hypothetical protein
VFSNLGQDTYVFLLVQGCLLWSFHLPAAGGYGAWSGRAVAYAGETVSLLIGAGPADAQLSGYLFTDP